MGVVSLAELCAEGVHINWSQFLVNELLQDAATSEEEGRPFHYVWLLILISFVVWSNPPK